MTEYVMRIMEFAIPCLLIWGVLIVSMTNDRSRYRNCVFLMAAVLSTMPLICSLAGKHYAGAAFAMSLVILLMILTAPAALVANGLVMIRRENLSPANLLSLILGVVIGIGELSFFCLRLLPDLWSQEYAQIVRDGMTVSLFIGVSIVYGSLSFAAFALYTMLLQIVPRKRDFDYIVIHGSGLLGGERVGRLLADRIDKAVSVYRMDPTPSVIIPSGGQGKDEKISEAEAMRRYLVGQGIPQEHILMEDRSTTTRENVLFSKEIIESREGRHYTALVTSNYHIYRALRYARDLGFDCTGIGAHVAPYYWPSALIREYIAIHTEKTAAVVFLLGWAAVMALTMKLGVGRFLQ